MKLLMAVRAAGNVHVIIASICVVYLTDALGR